MNKTCPSCNKDKSTEDFNKNKSSPDGLCYICRECGKLNDKNYRNTPKGRANKTWHKILQRVQNKDGKNPSYSHIKLKMTYEEFMEWAIPAYTNWFETKPNISPSLNRIDSNGNYEIKNLELISFEENRKMGLTKAWASRVPRGPRFYKPITEESLCNFIEIKCKKYNLDLHKIYQILLNKLSKNK